MNLHIYPKLIRCLMYAQSRSFLKTNILLSTLNIVFSKIVKMLSPFKTWIVYINTILLVLFYNIQSIYYV